MEARASSSCRGSTPPQSNPHPWTPLSIHPRCRPVGQVHSHTQTHTLLLFYSSNHLSGAVHEDPMSHCEERARSPQTVQARRVHRCH
eukprot:4747745-Alexandrium_andersonii.AAC.1